MNLSTTYISGTKLLVKCNFICPLCLRMRWRLGRAIRKHWGIENQVHWTLDVTFNEDQCRIRSFHAPRNFALLRPMALNALNLEKTIQRSLRQKSKRAAMNNEYMMTVLHSFCQA